MNTNNLGSFLGGILTRTKEQLAQAKSKTSEQDLIRRIESVPAVRSFKEALRSQFGLIAEIKEKSPSAGWMRRKNVDAAPKAYQRSPIVNAISVLTNHADFGMKMERLWRIRKQTTKPILRKDFIFDPYQVYEARAHGADAILLMANILNSRELCVLSQLAFELGMDVLFEAHSQKELQKIPHGSEIIGINCRKLDSSFHVGSYGVSKVLRSIGLFKDLSIKDEPLKLVSEIPKNTLVKVAESGMTPSKIARVRDEFGYNAALVGNSLLLAEKGIEWMLSQFEESLSRTSDSQVTRKNKDAAQFDNFAHA